MFDFSVWELVVIGGVALVVIGPERLPRVARTAGHLLGRFQRYVAEVKSDINREIELAELKKLQTTVQDAAREIEQTVREGAGEAEKHLKEAQGEIKAAGEELKKAEQELTSGFTPPHMGTSTVPPESGAAKLVQVAARVNSPSQLADLVAAAVVSEPDNRLRVIEELNVERRIDYVTAEVASIILMLSRGRTPRA